MSIRCRSSGRHPELALANALRSFHSGPVPAPAPPQIFSTARRRAVYARAVARQSRRNAARYLLDDMREEVKERLAFMHLRPAAALVIGDPSGSIARDLAAPGGRVDALAAGHWQAEQPFASEAYDLIVHDHSLTTINDLPGALLQLHVALQPGGLLICAFPGAGSLPALRRAMLAAEPDRPHPRVHPQIDNRTISALLQRAGFGRQVVDSYELAVRFRDLDTLVSDLRDQALGNVLQEAAPSLDRVAQRRAEVAFDALRDDSGRVTETFAMIVLTAWRG